MNSIIHDLNSTFGDVIDIIGPPPLTSFPPSGSTSLPPADPARIASELFGINSLDNRAHVLATLERAFPGTINDGKPRIDFHGTALVQSAGAGVPEHPASLVAAQTLATYAGELANLEPLDHGRDHVGWESLVPLVQNAIAQIVNELSGKAPALEPHVDVRLEAICGYKTPPAFPLNVHTIGGWLGEIRDALALDARYTNTFEQEQMLKRFVMNVALTDMLLRAWAMERDDMSGEFFATGIHELRRILFALVASLRHLRELVPNQAVWATTELATTPPVLVGSLWQWMYSYASQGALATLQHGPAGLREFRSTISTFIRLLETGLLNPRGPIPGTGSGYGGSGTSYCDGLPSAFTDDKVKTAVRELLCHLQQALAAADREPELPLPQMYFCDAGGTPVTTVPQGEIVRARLIGTFNPATAQPIMVFGNEQIPATTSYDANGQVVCEFQPPREGYWQAAWQKPGADPIPVEGALCYVPPAAPAPAPPPAPAKKASRPSRIRGAAKKLGKKLRPRRRRP